ncbi:DUF4097 family beta strand repeat-containing protein [uncultured Paludibaculum sp.]|uniref:DUF4097 family beta strand repeat-containing protein n=1 Tax=uncultured Paludibaculum sp. TaxID=1765020 RepID=UPI002AAB5A5B|nr:DUF4097 family beta strand repeat-containing protein [uncultured Paludibaculum sp.]
MKTHLLTFAAILLAGSPAEASETRTVDRTLPVTAEVELDVVSNPGGVTVTAGSSAVVRIRATIKPLLKAVDLGLADANIQALAQNPPIEQTGNRIRIGYVSDPAFLRGVTIHFEIETPQATRVHAHTSSGRIQIDGIDGPALADSSSGGIEISNVTTGVVVKTSSGAVVIRKPGGPLSARTTSGGIQVVDAGATVDVETGSGRTELSQIRGGVRARTQSGSIRIDNVDGAVVATNHSGSIDVLQVSGSVQAETGSGAIQISQLRPAAITARARSGALKVELAKGQGYTLDAQSNSGKVSGPATTGADDIARPHQLKGQVGVGGPLVDLDTHSSRITIQ